MDHATSLRWLLGSKLRAENKGTMCFQLEFLIIQQIDPEIFEIPNLKLVSINCLWSEKELLQEREVEV